MVLTACYYASCSRIVRGKCAVAVWTDSYNGLWPMEGNRFDLGKHPDALIRRAQNGRPPFPSVISFARPSLGTDVFPVTKLVRNRLYAVFFHPIAINCIGTAFYQILICPAYYYSYNYYYYCYMFLFSKHNL